MPRPVPHRFAKDHEALLRANRDRALAVALWAAAALILVMVAL